MVESLEKIPVGGVCLKCGGTSLHLSYANIGFDMWYECVTCGELGLEEIQLDRTSSLNNFIRVILSGGGEDEFD